MIEGTEPVSTRDGDSKEDMLKEARDRARMAFTYWQDNFDSSRDDIRFLNGDQWPSLIKKQREDAGRPCLTLNKLPQYVDQILGDQRQSRPSIQIHPTEDDVNSQQKLSNVAGNQDYSLSEVYEALIRNIEYTSNAEAHYDTAAQHAVEGGFGWLRVLTGYSKNDTFDLDASIKHIKDRYSVLIDPIADEPDFSDAGWCFIGDVMPKKEFDIRYPNKRTGSLVEDRGEDEWWRCESGVKIAEYFYREPADRVLLLLSDGRTVYEDEVKPILDELAESGVTEVRRRKIKCWVVKWMKITAHDILEGPIDWPGSTVPVVPVFGKELIVDGKLCLRSLIRFGKDAQKMHNFWMTAATERVALAPKSQWVAEAEAIEGYEEEWEKANTENASVLRFNAGHNAPKREQPPSMPAAELQLALSANDELKSTLGIYDASVGAQGNETSGKAIMARQRQGDRGTFAFSDNRDRAIRRCGQILIEIIPKVYDGERVLRLRFEDGEGDYVKINEMIIDEETGKPVMVHDVAAGKFDVTVSSGPSHQTQRLEAADSMMQFVQAMPSTASVMMDLIAKNMDWPGAKEIAERLRRVLPSGVLTQQELEDEGIEPPQPTPEQQVAMSEAEANKAAAEAKMTTIHAESEAKIAQANASLEESRVRMAELNARAAEIDLAANMMGPDSIEETIRNLVAKAMAEIIAAQQQV